MVSTDTSEATQRLPLRSRRTVLKMMAALGASVAAGGMSPASADSIRMRTVPGTGEQLPVIGLGTYRTFDVGSDIQALAGPKEVLQRFVATGGRVVDSSPMYGQAERVVGDLAAALGVEDRLFYATKVWISGREAGTRQMQRSLQLMRTRRIDLMQIHNLVDWRTHIKTLYGWKQQGHIRYVGITHYANSAFDELADIMKREAIDFVQFPYNVVNRDAERNLLPLAADRGIAVLVNEPFEQGNLFRLVRSRRLPSWAHEFDCQSWAQFFLKYIIAHPAVTCPIPATSKPAHLIDNMQAGFGGLPDDIQRKRMADYMDAL
jgi:diketogulonate reductase-like aldo/keto reductase